MRQVNEAGILLVQKHESCRLKAYRDTGGVWTIGWGHTGKHVVEGMTITQEQADDFLLSDLDWAEEAVCQHIKVELNDNQFAALVDFVFNEGETQFAKSTLVRVINNGAYDEVPNQLRRWIYDNGVVLQELRNRREDEAVLWDTPADSSNDNGRAA